MLGREQNEIRKQNASKRAKWEQINKKKKNGSKRANLGAVSKIGAKEQNFFRNGSPSEFSLAPLYFWKKGLNAM